MRAEIRKRLGEFLILFIYLLIEGFGIWPISHFWSLVSTVIGVAALLLLDGGFSEKKIFVIAAVLAVFCAIVYFIAPPIPPPDPWRGWLQAADEPTPSGACGIIREGGMIVLLGDSGFTASAAFLAQTGNKFVPLSVCKRPARFIEKGPNGMRIDATIYNKDGTSLGEITNNGYNIPKNDTLIVEHSADLSTLVVHNVSGDELLYLHYLNPHAVRLRGIFSCERQPKFIVTITNDAIFPLTGMHHACAADAYTGFSIN